MCGPFIASSIFINIVAELLPFHFAEYRLGFFGPVVGLRYVIFWISSGYLTISWGTIDSTMLHTGSLNHSGDSGNPPWTVFTTRMLADAVETSESINVGETTMAVENTPGFLSEKPKVDIEHVPVNDDPRAWSLFQKVRETWLQFHGSVMYGW